MVLPIKTIGMDEVRSELNRNNTISLGDSDVRKLAKKTTGTISMDDLRGKKASDVDEFKFRMAYRFSDTEYFKASMYGLIKNAIEGQVKDGDITPNVIKGFGHIVEFAYVEMDFSYADNGEKYFIMGFEENVTIKAVKIALPGIEETCKCTVFTPVSVKVDVSQNIINFLKNNKNKTVVFGLKIY